MDIEKALRDEHSKKQTMRIVHYIGNDKTRFKKLMDLFLNGEYRITQRAAWPLSYAAVENPKLVSPYFPKLIKKLKEPGLHPAIPRNILRTFQEMEIPEKYHGELVNICFASILNASQPAAIRAFAITVSCHICIQYPELKKELLLMLEEMNKYSQQPAIKSRLKHAFKFLKD
jgi:hypothetical protein